MLSASTQESFALFRRRVPHVVSAGFFDVTKEFGGAIVGVGSSARDRLTPVRGPKEPDTVEKRRV